MNPRDVAFDPGLDCCPGLVIVRHDVEQLKTALSQHSSAHERLEGKIDHLGEELRAGIDNEVVRRREDRSELQRVLTASAPNPPRPGVFLDRQLNVWQSLGLGLLGFLVAAVGRDIVLWLWHLIVSNSGG